MTSKDRNWPDEDLIETNVRCILDVAGAFFVVENVPARVNSITGEQLFSPLMVEQIQQIALSNQTPGYTVDALVHDLEQSA